MLIQMMMRRRPVITEAPLPQFVGRITDRLSDIRGLWSEAKIARDAKLDFGGESASLDLTKVLSSGLAGGANFTARFEGYLNRDQASEDDFIHLQIDTEVTNYREFCLSILPKLLETFDAYRAAIQTDKTVRAADWERVRTARKASGRDVDGRDGVFRIWPFSYFDDLLCQRSFGLSAEEVVRRAAPGCEHAALVNGGAFLLITFDLVTGVHLDELNDRMMQMLGMTVTPQA